jgi:hypothetical protein
VENYAYFLMDDFYRKYLIERHIFFFDQSKTKLLTQFQNIEQEADLLSDKWLDEMAAHFDPDRDDPGDLYERANDKSIEHYQLLTELHNMTRLSIASGMFHLWEKGVRDWIVNEVRHWHRGSNVNAKVWAVKFHELMNFFTDLGWKIREESFFSALGQCRHVVNVYKHGGGESFKTLKDSHPNFFKSLGPDLSYTPSHDDLTLTDLDLELFSDAIIEFWKSIPSEVRGSNNFKFPQWFEDAFRQDINERVKKEKLKNYSAPNKHKPT